MPRATGHPPHGPAIDRSNFRARAASGCYGNRVRDAGFASFLQRSLETLAHERPDVAARLAATLAGLEVTVEVDGEGVLLGSDGERVVCAPALRPAAVVVRATRATVLALADGELALLDAVRSDRLHLQGTARDLARFHAALGLYLQGAVRAPSFPDLLHAFRAASASGGQPCS